MLARDTSSCTLAGGAGPVGSDAAVRAAHAIRKGNCACKKVATETERRHTTSGNGVAGAKGPVTAALGATRGSCNT